MKLLVALEARKSSLAIAVQDQQVALTYAELYALAGTFAEALTHARNVSNARVLILLPRGVEAFICIYGVLVAGYCYIPIDPSIPPDRLRYIIEQAGPDIVVTDRRLFDTHFGCWVDLPFEVLLVGLDCQRRQMLAQAIPATVRSLTAPNREQDLAYIIFTSGSTGKPKGVMVSISSFDIFIQEITRHIPYYHEQTVYLSILPFHFDGSIIDLFPTILAGGRVYLMSKFLLPSQFLSCVEKNEVTFTCVTSSLLKLLESASATIASMNLQSLKAIWYGTESCPKNIIRRLAGMLPGLAFIQGYGPTEATCTSHVYFLSAADIRSETDDDAEFFPIGKPLNTVEALVADRNGDMCAPGEPGELLLGGPQIMVGYCNDAVTTAKAFRIINDRIFYRSGDIVTATVDGTYRFIGREDDMLKLHGRLIYTGEIEACARELNWIEDAVVVPLKADGMVEALACFLVTANGANRSHDDVRSHLRRRLPEYMVPRWVSFLDQLPVGSSGKLDRAALTRAAESKAKEEA